jgi:hypothetical protein
MVTLDAVMDAIPPNFKGSVTQALVDKLNNLAKDCDVEDFTADTMRHNFVTYADILKEGKFKLTDYMNAVKFVSFCMMNMTAFDAWCKTFPERHHALVKKGTSKKDMSSHVSMYKKGELVNMLMGQITVPFHIYNLGARQKALDAQLRLGLTASSDLVRTQALNSVLVHTTPPAPVKNSQLSVTVDASDSLKALTESMRQLATKQRQAIVDGTVNTKSLAASNITDAVVDD